LKTIISSVKKAFIGYCRSSQELSKGPLTQPEGSRKLSGGIEGRIDYKAKGISEELQGFGHG
jgi:hypothetical protein